MKKYNDMGEGLSQFKLDTELIEIKELKYSENKN